MKKNEITRLGKKAVRMAQKENKTFGLPNVISKNGKIYYELPTGEIKENFCWETLSSPNLI